MLFKIILSIFLIIFPIKAQKMVGECQKHTIIRSSTGYLMALSARQKNNQVFGINQNIQEVLYRLQNGSIGDQIFIISTQGSTFFNVVTVPMDFSDNQNCPEEYWYSTQGVDLHAVSSSFLWRTGIFHWFYGASTTGSVINADQRLQWMGSMGLIMLYSITNFTAPFIGVAPFGQSIGFSAFPQWAIGGGATLPWAGTISYGYISSGKHLLDWQSPYKVFINSVFSLHLNRYQWLKAGLQDLWSNLSNRRNFRIYYQDVFLAVPPTLDSNGNPIFNSDLGEHQRGIQAEFIPASGLGARLLWNLYPHRRFQATSAFWIFPLAGGSSISTEYGIMHTPDLYFYGVRPRWLHTLIFSIQTELSRQAPLLDMEFGKNSLEQFSIFPYSQDSWFIRYRLKW